MPRASVLKLLRQPYVPATADARADLRSPERLLPPLPNEQLLLVQVYPTMSPQL